MDATRIFCAPHPDPLPTGERGKRWAAACAVMTLLMSFSGSLNAAEYKPGRVGYLYDNCAAALEKSASPQEFLSTYCGGFVEGYGAGVLAVNNIPLTAPDEKDPCAIPKAEMYGRINARFCPALPDYSSGKVEPGTILQSAADIAARWIDFPKTKKQRAALFKKQAMKEINAIIRPGKFCDALEQYGPPKNPPFIINSALLKANWYDLAKTGPSIADKISRCKSDLAQEDFSQTRCAAEITGFIAGLHATAHLQDHKQVKGACAKQIERFYTALDTPNSKCVSYETNPADIARVFTDNEKDWVQNAPALLGAAGYYPVYYGYMCRAKSE